MDSEQAFRFDADVAARANGVPFQYLLGTASFYGREFAVGPGVFIPRPETEILIDAVLNLLVGTLARGQSSRSGVPGDELSSPLIVDVGTGCGAIAITLVLEHPGLRVLATDRSSHALSFARRNAQRLQAPISFLQGDLAAPLATDSVDLMVANLPYLDSSASSSWPRELYWEPWLALDGGEGGLVSIRELFQQACSVLKSGGFLILEIGADQADQAGTFAKAHGFRVDRIVPDLAGLERIVVLWKS